MKIEYFCPYWGSEAVSIEHFCEKVKAAGFDGVEMGIPLDKARKTLVLDSLDKFDLQLIGQHGVAMGLDFEAGQRAFQQHLENRADSPALFINSQTGKDYYSFENNKALIDIAQQVTARTRMNVLHETHRGKFSFAAHITAEYLKRIPDLRISLDISHWCNVSESYLDDQQEAVDLALGRTDHIHARVGYQEGPQVPDPRAPEWQEALEVHAAWWGRVIQRHAAQGAATFTMTPEFGPPPYMTLMPHTRQPLASQWDVNVFMMNFLKERFAEQA